MSALFLAYVLDLDILHTERLLSRELLKFFLPILQHADLQRKLFRADITPTLTPTSLRQHRPALTI